MLPLEGAEKDLKKSWVYTVMVKEMLMRKR